MTERERYVRALTFGNPDKLPLTPGGPRRSTLRRWYAEGLPEGVNAVRHIIESLGIGLGETGGDKMAYRGGIDKRAIAAGGETMRAEVMRVVPPLLREGGFIPSCDHGVPPDISLQNFTEYTRLLAQLTGWL